MREWQAPQHSKNALACETSTRPATRCHCRCAGERHGLRRFLERSGSHELPADDPHYSRKRERQRPWPQLTIERVV
jgi:hypothetical protein